MKKNMILLVVGVALVSLLIGIPIVANTHSKLSSTQGMVQDIDAVVNQYLQEHFLDAKSVRVRHYYYEYDEKEEGTAQTTENNPYPFASVRAIVRIDSVDHTLYIIPDENGALYVEKCIAS